jgi:YHS domain-containing protein
MRIAVVANPMLARSMLACSMLAGLAVAVPGCSATTGERAATASTQPHAECLVCKANADLACIDVSVDSKTPSYAYNDKTYYFCSNECRKAFAKNPSRYVSR